MPMLNTPQTGRWFTPATWIYLLVHVLLVALGYALMSEQRFNGVGASLVAAGITGIVVFVYLRFSQNATALLRMVAEFGFVAAFDARAARIKAEYDKRLRSAHNIDVIGFGLNDLREDYRDEFPEWAQRCQVRILLIDPSYPSEVSSYAQQRETEEGDRPGSIAASVEAFLQQTQALRAAGESSRFRIRLYRCLPSVNIFRVDDEIFWGPYLIGGPSRNHPTFVVKKGGILYQKLLDHFETIWKSRSTPV